MDDANHAVAVTRDNIGIDGTNIPFWNSIARTRKPRSGHHEVRRSPIISLSTFSIAKRTTGQWFASQSPSFFSCLAFLWTKQNAPPKVRLRT